jgi:hypothetical protein
MILTAQAFAAALESHDGVDNCAPAREATCSMREDLPNGHSRTLQGRIDTRDPQAVATRLDPRTVELVPA